MTGHIQDLNELPPIEDALRLSRAMALVDAILMPEWEYRYFSFDAHWDIVQKEMMASMRDGSGGEYFLLFSENGIVGKVLSEDSLDDVEGSLAQVPDVFSSFKSEVAFNLSHASYFFWCLKEDGNWLAQPGGLPKYDFLKIFVDGVQGYHRWAEGYYERAVDLSIVAEIYRTLRIDEEQLAALNPDLTLADLGEDMSEILG